MLKFALSGVAAALVLATAPASAAISFSSYSTLAAGRAALNLNIQGDTFNSYADGATTVAFHTPSATSAGFVQSVTTTNQYTNPHDATGFADAPNKFFTVPQVTSTGPGSVYNAMFSGLSTFEQFGILLGSPDGAGNQIRFFNGTTLLGTFTAPIATRSNADTSYYVISGFGQANAFELVSANNIAMEIGEYTTAVPEPGEWAMMLAGLGVVSLIARRRKASV